MGDEKIVTRQMDDFLRDIALDGTFFKYLLYRSMADARMAMSEDDLKTYILRDGSSNLYKIGKASNVKKRVSMLKCGNPFISLFAIISYDCEAELHKLFDSKRFEREWFNLADEDIKYITENYDVTLYQKYPNVLPI